MTHPQSTPPTISLSGFLRLAELTRFNPDHPWGSVANNGLVVPRAAPSLADWEDRFGAVSRGEHVPELVASHNERHAQ